MPKEYLNPPELFNSIQYGFSQMVTSTGGKTVYFSGQVGWNAQQEIAKGDFAMQTHYTFQNLQTAVEVAGGKMSDILSLRIYIVQSQMGDTSAVSKALKAFFPEGCAPASTWLGVFSLANPDFLIEVEAIAVIE